MNDKQELEAGTNPFVSDDNNAVEFILGFTSGEILYASHSSLYYLSGWVLSGFSSQPLTYYWADIRDSLYSAVTLDVPGFLVNVMGVGPIGGDTAKAVGNIGKFGAKHVEKVKDIARYVLKNFPGDETFRINAYDKLYGLAASALKDKGVSTSRIDELINAGIDLKKHDEGLSIYKGSGRKVGDDIGDLAQVHNTGDAAFSDNIPVYFYAGDPDTVGSYLGEYTITGGISKDGSKTAVLNG